MKKTLLLLLILMLTMCAFTATAFANESPISESDSKYSAKEAAWQMLCE